MTPSSNGNPTRAAINRANSEHSTGPRTPAGKQRSSLNALRHHADRDIPYDPAQDGFVCSIAEIKTFIQRRDRLEEAYSEPEHHLATAS